jgi:hypothetical protein
MSINHLLQPVKKVEPFEDYAYTCITKVHKSAYHIWRMNVGDFLNSIIITSWYLKPLVSFMSRHESTIIMFSGKSHSVLGYRTWTREFCVDALWLAWWCRGVMLQLWLVMSKYGVSFENWKGPILELGDVNFWDKNGVSWPRVVPPKGIYDLTFL